MILAKSGVEFINLHLKFENLPKSFSVFGYNIALYGCVIALGMLAGIAIATYMAKKTNQDPGIYTDFAIYAIIISVICARIYYVIFSMDYYSKHPAEIFNLRGGGLAIYGGVIGAVITCFVYTKIKKQSFTLMADTGIYGLILGQIIGRYGNFFNREAFGQVLSNKSLTAMRIYFDDKYSITQVPDQIRQAMEKMTGKSLEDLGYIQVQPTFLYESMWNLLVLILMLVFRKKKKFDGEILLWYLLGYGLGRSIIEGMRSDQLIMPITGWPVSQFLSIVLALTALTIIIVKRVKLSKQNK